MADISHVNKSMNVLVVDDFATMRRVVKTCLTQLGFVNIQEADDGVAALEKLRKDKFGLIISDWNMPNMMGIDLLREVRKDEKLKATPFVMVTAEAQKENVMQAVQAGVSNYVIKPFNASILEEKLSIVFKK